MLSLRCFSSFCERGESLSAPTSSRSLRSLSSSSVHWQPWRTRLWSLRKILWRRSNSYTDCMSSKS